MSLLFTAAGGGGRSTLHEAGEGNVIECIDGMVMASGNMHVELDNEGYYGNYFKYATIFKYDITWSNF